MTNSNSKTRPLTKTDFIVPVLLVLLSVVPTIGGVARLASIAHKTVTPENARFLQAPVPVLIHVFSATTFCLLGAFQFSRGFRLRFPRWHRRAGKLLALCGLSTGLSGMWMTVFYAIPTSLQGSLLYAVRLAVATAMIACLVIGWRRILRRDVPGHEAFMIRAYALGQGAGTQVLILLPWMLISGQSGGFTRDVLLALSWAINVVLAEAIVRRKVNPSTRARLGQPNSDGSAPPVQNRQPA